jgi:hypothetical protein
MHAYTGKILHIDLTTGRHKIDTFDESFAQKYIGGTGFGIKTLMLPRLRLACRGVARAIREQGLSFSATA